MHVGTAFRGRRCEHDPIDRRWASECYLLSDEASNREAEEIDLTEFHGVEELQRAQCRFGHRMCNLALRPTHTPVVEGDDASVGGQGIDEGRIPVVEVASEVDQEDQRATVPARVAVRKGATS